MKQLLHLKHWQLFLLIVGFPIVLESVFMGAMLGQNPSLLIIIFPIIAVLVMGLFLGWFYTLGVNLHKKLPDTVQMNLNKFKLFLVVPLVYMVFIFIFFFSAFSKTTDDGEIAVGLSNDLILLIFPLHLFCMFCIFYCLYFNAKALKAVEWQRPVTFSDFAGEFFLLWLFPFGVWILQPRINNLFARDNDSTDLMQVDPQR